MQAVFRHRGTRRTTVGIDRLDESNAGLPGSEHDFGVGEGARTQHVHDEIVSQLVVRAWIVDELRSTFLLFGIYEPRTASTRTQRGGGDGLQPEVSLVVESG